MTTFRLQNNKRRLYYRVRGTGEHLLLIHGLGSTGADWECQVRALEQRFRVIVPDLPGCGFSSSPEGDFSISDLANTLWMLLDHLKVPAINIAGFSLGGAVALEMALQRPQCVPRLALINTLLTYSINHWRKWLEARLTPLFIGLLGMKRTAKFAAARLFPKPWQRPIRERAAHVIGCADTSTYLGMARALERWSAVSRLSTLEARTLMIAAEHDFTPLAEKVEMAKALGAQIAVIHGSRHATPFDSMEATNACLLALLRDRRICATRRLQCDGAPGSSRLARLARLVDERTSLHCLEFGA